METIKKMFNNELKLEVLGIKQTVEELMKEIADLKKDYNDYLEWKKQRDANAQAAAKMGHFYVSADDTALLERLIQECNQDPDLAVLLTTAQGTTLTLRSYPKALNNKIESAMNRFSTGE